jgi:mannosylglycoprotein endo-beta-mannosidase
MLTQRGFDENWCKWVKAVVSSGTLSVQVNGSIGSYFKSGKGVRQGDPPFSLLFNLAVDGLAKMIYKAKENGLVKGLVQNILIMVWQCCSMQTIQSYICLEEDL